LPPVGEERTFGDFRESSLVLSSAHGTIRKQRPETGVLCCVMLRYLMKEERLLITDTQMYRNNFTENYI